MIAPPREVQKVKNEVVHMASTCHSGSMFDEGLFTWLQRTRPDTPNSPRRKYFREHVPGRI
ncbi:hypothetical protein [Nitrosomonas sp.]|uniref:hypothetical protein n=1 Tax=Nitrosomonas sp. TaxID=42353 RepID=UPI003305F0A4